MKKILLYLFVIFLSAIGLASCVVDTTLEDNTVEEVQEAVLRLTAPTSHGAQKAPGTRAATDDQISYVRLLFFKSSTGKLVYNKYYDMSVTNNPITLTINIGTYDIIFVANEHVDAAMHSTLDGLAWGSSISAFESLYFNSSSINSNDPIPGCGIVRNVDLDENDVVKVNGVTVTTPSWDISPYLKRLAIRVDLTITGTRPWHWTAMEQVLFSRVPDKVYLLEHKLSGVTIYNNASYEASARSVPRSEFTQSGYVYKKERIILPESVFSNKADNTKAYLLSVDLADIVNRSVTFGVDEGSNNHTAPRNSYFRISGTYSDDDSIKFALELIDWNEMIIPM